MVAFLIPIMVISANAELKQILIDKDNIKSLTSYGKFNQTYYTNFYNASNLFDNNLADYSSFSDWKQSGISLELKKPLDKPVCGVELHAINPKNQHFKLQINNITFTGFLNLPFASGTVTPCEKDVSSIKIDFTPDKSLPIEKQWTTVSELKLFTNGTVIDPEPPVCPPGTHWDKDLEKCVPDVISGPGGGNATTINLDNTNVTMNVKNSNMSVTLDENSTISFPDSDENGGGDTVVTNTQSSEDEEEEDEDNEEEEDENKN